MKRTHSVLSKELKRSCDGVRKKYRADIAQTKYEKRKHKQRRGKLDKYPELKDYVEKKIRLDWSPEQIAGRLKEYPRALLESTTISHESIYYYIYEKSEKHKRLYQHLRTHRSKRRVYSRRKGSKVKIKERISIHDRPVCINEKLRYGDWETDSVEFKRIKGNNYLSVQYERKSQLARIHKVRTKNAEDTKDALIKTAESVPRELFKTITFDNGVEGSKHYEINRLYNTKTYFCDSFKSWQKGGVENMNKLIRQYLPRKLDIRDISDDQIYQIQEKLNNRPRKGLNYLTPNEVIHKVVPH
jgi:IS30 family transposase